jgi:hypothetical protein
VAREVDKRKTGKALRRLKRVAERAAERAAAAGGPGLTDWEKDFVAGVSERLETYGSAFRDPAKGALDEALSQRQTQVVRALDKKGRPKNKEAEKPGEANPARPAPRSTFKRKAPVRTSRGRDINEDLPVEPAAPTVETPATPSRRGWPALRVITGGKAGPKNS